MAQSNFTDRIVDAQLVALAELFEQHAREADAYFARGCATPEQEDAEEVRLAAVERALVEAASDIRHRSGAGRIAKERMLAHLNRWAGTTTAERPSDSTCYGDRLAWSLRAMAA